MNDPQPKPSARSIRPRELHQILTRGAKPDLIDVRTPAEHAAASIPEARLVPLDRLDAAQVLRDREQPAAPLYVICQSGMRASKAIQKLEQAGFHQCILLEGGLQAWIEAGLPVHRKPSKALPLMQQVQIVVGFISLTGAALALTVDRAFAVVPLLAGGGLLFAGLSGWCGLALLLARMPWNRATNGSSASCCR